MLMLKWVAKRLKHVWSNTDETIDTSRWGVQGVQTVKCLFTKQCLMVFGRQTFIVCPGPKKWKKHLLCSSSSLSRFIKNNECILSISRSQSIATFTHLGWGTLNTTTTTRLWVGHIMDKISKPEEQAVNWPEASNVVHTRETRRQAHARDTRAILKRSFLPLCTRAFCPSSKQPYSAGQSLVLQETV